MPNYFTLLQQKCGEPVERHFQTRNEATNNPGEVMANGTGMGFALLFLESKFESLYVLNTTICGEASAWTDACSEPGNGVPHMQLFSVVSVHNFFDAYSGLFLRSFMFQWRLEIHKSLSVK